MDQWTCPDCDTTVWLHVDPGHHSHDWTRDYIAHHEWLHGQQLIEHAGDREALRLRLNHPARAHALTMPPPMAPTEEP